MPMLQEGNLAFDFPADWRAVKLDEWGFFRRQFQTLGHVLRLPCSNRQCNAELRCSACGTAKTAGVKAVDIVALAADGALWLIEVKDYRGASRTKAIDLADEIALKVRDSLALLFAAAVRSNELEERAFAADALRALRLRVVLHLEQPPSASRTQTLIRPADVLQRLKQLVKAVDPRAMVVDSQGSANVPWGVASVP